MSGSGLLPRVPQVRDIDYPWQGQPRAFTAAAMPNGDPQFGVSGQLVLVIESRGGGVPRQKLYSREEAAQLYDQLRQALGAFALGERYDADREDCPRAACGPFPFNHRSLAEVMVDEAAEPALSAKGFSAVEREGL